MKNRRGFTLIELLLALSLITVAALLMYSFFGQGLSLYTMETEMAGEQDSLRQVLSDITNRVRLADPSTITYNSGALSIGSAVYSFDSAGKEIRRNGATLATGVSAFGVTLTSELLQISITNTAGTVISTSLSLT
jgi:prepilin-type N-terminal cleavage/methylation domain